MHRRRFFVADVTVLAVVAVVVVSLSLLTASGGGHRTTTVAATIPSSGSFARAPAIPAGFLGLSLEYTAIEPYAGTDPAAIDPLLKRLIGNLSPGSSPVLRIGGDSSDAAWWPVGGISRRPGVSFSLSQNWLSVTRALASALRARLILGVNLEAGDRTLAAAEANALLGGIGSARVRALEVGNEPELYGAFAWYRTADGRAVTGRPRSYHFGSFLTDFTDFAAVLPHFPLAGPAVSGPRWVSDLNQFIASAPRLGLVTLHRYPLQNCFIPSHSPRYPTIEHLLSNTASKGLADALAPPTVLAHAHGLPLRIDELNSVSCGANHSVSGSFAAALWALDALFELARAGIDGVNVHTFPGAGYELFKLARVNGRWRASVAPEYYGLLMFAQAAPTGSHLMRIGSGNGPVKIWATRGSDGLTRVAVINKDIGRGRRVILRGVGGPGAARVELLQGPGAAATSGVTIGGQSFGSQTETGTLSGSPRTVEIEPSGNGYAITLPPVSAALLTIPERHG
jgi:hypothetical protein